MTKVISKGSVTTLVVLSRRQFMGVTVWAPAAMALPQVITTIGRYVANNDDTPQGRPPTSGAARRVTKGGGEETLYAPLLAKKGAPYRREQVVSHSRYFEPIIQNGEPRGISRIYGDAPAETQRYAIDVLMTAARAAGMAAEHIALVLAIARLESGYNPDAAAGTTSALGLGQFINKTGEAYGLTDANRFDVAAQARALVRHTADNIIRAHRFGLPIELAYALHHDGSLDNRYGGMTLSRTHIAPLLPRMRVFVQDY